MPRSLLSLIGFLLLCGCEPELCDKEIDRETAVQIAREYFLSRSIAQLEAGRPFEQKEAMRMRRAGMTEETYRETFEHAEPEGARRVGNQLCGHPLIYYQAIKSLNYDGFDVSFRRLIPDDDIKRWRLTVTFVNITKCGRRAGIFGTSTTQMFYEGSDYERIAAPFRACP
jgi:hypothetical protein